MNLDPTITFGGIGSIASIIGVGLAMAGTMRRNRKENDAEMRASEDRIKMEARERDARMLEEIGKHNDSVEKRLSAVEFKTADFVPRSEITGMFEHEKASRAQIFSGLKERADQASRDIGDMKVDMGKLYTKVDGFTDTIVELKGLIKELARDVKSEIGSMRDVIAKASA